MKILQIQAASDHDYPLLVHLPDSEDLKAFLKKRLQPHIIDISSYFCHLPKSVRAYAAHGPDSVLYDPVIRYKYPDQNGEERYGTITGDIFFAHFDPEVKQISGLNDEEFFYTRQTLSNMPRLLYYRNSDPVRSCYVFYRDFTRNPADSFIQK